MTAALGLAAAIAAGVALLPRVASRRSPALALAPVASVVTVVAITAAAAAAWSPNSHHGGDEATANGEAAADGHAAGAHDDHGGDEEPATRSAALIAAEEAGWPWEWDPSEPIDFASVPGVSEEQAGLATELVETAQREMPQFADYRVAEAAGYVTINDGGTGEEHFVNASLINDGKHLDPTAPETVMYSVDPDTGARTLSGAMFIAEQPEYELGSEELDAILGPLASWHVHTNVCFEPADGGTRVAGLVDDNGECPEGQFTASADLPMVHVWVVPHPCGPFAALEGVGAGQSSDDEADRIDWCKAAEAEHD